MKRAKRRITLEEIVDDIIYFSLSAFVAVVATFIFDIHWSFYKSSLFPLKRIFKSIEPYLAAAFGGGILGLVWIKVSLLALEKNTYLRIKSSFNKFGGKLSK